MRALARDSAVSQATAYRYLHETLEVIAQRSPDITDVLDRLRRRGEPFVAWTAPWCASTGSQPAPRLATTCGTRVSTRPSAATCRS